MAQVPGTRTADDDEVIIAIDGDDDIYWGGDTDEPQEIWGGDDGY